ncbi:MAG: hypothetical protein JW986_09860 [Methanotrichaceae archaeon]|nr:hypothetical protein [Methanotrichaceae archaeon]
MERIVDTGQIPKAGDLLGLLNYYEARLSRCDSSVPEAEFRGCKLSFVIDLIRRVEIPEDLKLEEIRSIIDGWRMVVPWGGPELSLLEMEEINESMDRVRGAVAWAGCHRDPKVRWLLSIALMLALPLRSSDLHAEAIPRVRESMIHVMEFLALQMEKR